MVTYVGVLNITPDSFSDGGRYLSVESARAQVEKLISDGAGLIDVGGDSTRPGSTCVGPKEEWNRVQSILPAVSELSPFAVDTHHANVAQSAIELGAQMVNDISAGHDPEMFSVVASAGVKYVMMYSRCSPPHQFQPETREDIISAIKQFFTERIEAATKAGVKEEQIILDPGMGKFISDSPEVSWNVIRRYGELTTFGLALYFGSSRKGFLKLPGEKDLLERDYLSAFTGALVVREVNSRVPLYLRCHNVSLQHRLLNSEL